MKKVSAVNGYETGKFDQVIVTVFVRHHHTEVGWRLQSHMNKQKAAPPPPPPPFWPCSAAREMISQSLKVLQDDFENKQKTNTQESLKHECFYVSVSTA